MSDHERKRAQPDSMDRTLRSFYDSATLMMGTVEITANDILHVSDNRATATFFNTTVQAMQGRTTRALGVPEHYIHMWLEAYKTSLYSGGPVRFDYEHEGKGWLKVTVNYIGLDAGRQCFSYVVDDITERKKVEQALQEARAELEVRVRQRTAELERANEQLQHDALHDALTGLPNRTLFTDRLGRAIERVKRYPESFFTVLFLDFDHFKVVNDSLGHQVGDTLLVAIGQRLAAGIRDNDTLARLGGDEFTILLEDCDLERAVEILESLRRTLSLPFKLGERELTVTASAGVVALGTGYRRPEEIIRDADTAMYQAKAQRPGHYRVFNAAMREQVVQRLELETELRRALGNREFRVYYQPIFSVESGLITSFEALLRWQHPTRGLVSPDNFIAVAEETGLIIALDRHVLGEACRQVSLWHTQFPTQTALSLSVNLSSQHFMRADLTPYIESVLARTKLHPERLHLEITEHLLMNQVEPVDVAVAQLKALGVGLYIDDFGTGYASLSYLQRFPVDVLKIDRSFIRQMTVNPGSAELVRAIVAMAQALKMRVIAEGIEKDEELALLRSLGCEGAQGYLFSKPLTAEQAAIFLSVRDTGKRS